MKCVFCGELLPLDRSCCDAAFISFASVELRYHLDCNHETAQQLISGADARFSAITKLTKE